MRGTLPDVIKLILTRHELASAVSDDIPSHILSGGWPDLLGRERLLIGFDLGR